MSGHCLRQTADRTCTQRKHAKALRTVFESVMAASTTLFLPHSHAEGVSKKGTHVGRKGTEKKAQDAIEWRVGEMHGPTALHWSWCSVAAFGQGISRHGKAERVGQVEIKLRQLPLQSTSGHKSMSDDFRPLVPRCSLSRAMMTTSTRFEVRMLHAAMRVGGQCCSPVVGQAHWVSLLLSVRELRYF